MMTRKSKFSPFDSVLSEGFTDLDCIPPHITVREGIAGLKEAYWLEKLEEKNIKQSNKGISKC